MGDQAIVVKVCSHSANQSWSHLCVCLPVSLSVCLSVSQSVCLSVCLSASRYKRSIICSMCTGIALFHLGKSEVELTRV